MTDRSTISLLGLGACPWSKRETGFTWRGCGSTRHGDCLLDTVLIFTGLLSVLNTDLLEGGYIWWLLTESLFYFSRAVLQALEDGLKKADADPSVKAVMICGENGKFSAGKTSNTGWAKDETFSTHITLLTKVLIWLEMATRESALSILLFHNWHGAHNKLDLEIGQK